MRTSFINNWIVSVTMAYHIRKDGDSVASAGPSTGVVKSEHIFAFVWGFGTYEMDEILNFLLTRLYHRVPSDHPRATAIMTPEQLLAEVLHKQDIIMSRELLNIKEKLRSNAGDMTEELLIKESGTLWNIRSTIHCLNGVIDSLLNKFDPFQTAVENWLKAQNDPDSKRIMAEVNLLDICQKYLLEKGRLEVIRQSIGQNQVEAQILQEHVNLIISKVSFYILL